MALWAEQRRIAASMVLAWVLETMAIWLPCLFANMIPDPGFDPSFFELFRYFLIVGTIVIEGDIICAHVVINGCYARVPRYKAGGPAPVATWGSIAHEFVSTMAPSILFGSAATAFGLTQMVALARDDFDRIVALSARPIFPDQASHLLLRLAVVRLAVDVAFYAFHRALHTPMFFGPLHRRHHEHRSPHVWTNYHFTAVDLFVEGFAPFGVGLAALELLGLRCSRLEYLLLLSHIMYYEIGSHAGKPAPVISYFPPFALAYNAFYAVVLGKESPDANNVWFHHCHHVFYTGNYGITPWLDAVLGTRKMPPPRFGKGSATCYAEPQDGDNDDGPIVRQRSRRARRRRLNEQVDRLGRRDGDSDDD